MTSPHHGTDAPGLRHDPWFVRTLAAVLIVGLALLLTGCGGSSAKPSYGRYVALGDSYTAAPGVEPSVSSDGCGNSQVNYPRLLAATLDAKLSDVSCSGAATVDFRRPQRVGTSSVPPQLQAVTRSTRLVTIGIGGNDLDLAGYVTRCLQDNSTCGPAVAAIRKQLTHIKGRVAATIGSIHKQAPQATVVVVGYPQIVPSSGSCSEFPVPEQFDPYVGAVMPALDQSLQAAARAEHATYIDVLAASKGHDICSADPWIAGISGNGAQQFHPNASEQKAVAALIASALGKD